MRIFTFMTTPIFSARPLAGLSRSDPSSASVELGVGLSSSTIMRRAILPAAALSTMPPTSTARRVATKRSQLAYEAIALKERYVEIVAPCDMRISAITLGGAYP